MFPGANFDLIILSQVKCGRGHPNKHTTEFTVHILTLGFFDTNKDLSGLFTVSQNLKPEPENEADRKSRKLYRAERNMIEVVTRIRSFP